MSKRDLVKLFALSIVVRMGMAALISRPGYMDTAYYAAGALRLAQGGGFSEPFVWNYLNDPIRIPHPGFLYWMPLPSLLAAPLARLFPDSFFALQVPFLFLSAALPLISYRLAWQTTESRGLAWAASLLTLFSGFFFPYWTLPETFAPFALFGSLALWLAGRARLRNRERELALGHWLLVGLLVGLAHLTRADGVLLLPVVLLGPILSDDPKHIRDGRSDRSVSGGRRKRISLTKTGGHLLIVVLGYLLIMGPWFARNVVAVGTPLSPAGTKTIWLTDYDDLFCYDCDLSLSAYLAWGWGNICRSKLSALWINAQRCLAENCLVFLLPFVAIGLHRLRRRPPFLLAGIYLVGVYLAHSLVFTFPGWRGGFFHASSAVLPMLYTAGTEGLHAAVHWAARRRRGWRYQQARSVFTAAAVTAAILLSAYIAWQRVTAWGRADVLYDDVDQWLTDRDAPRASVMVGNPPAFWFHTHRPAAVIPNEGVETLLQVADRYGMDYVLLDKHHPAKLADLHSGGVDHPRLKAVKTWPAGSSILYAVQR